MTQIISKWKLLILFFVGLTLPFLLWFVATNLPQSNPAFPEEHYSSFEGIKWGSPPSKVLRRTNRSETLTIQREEVFPNQTPSGTKLTIKKLQRHGDTIDVGYVFHPERGLVKGFYFSRFDRGDDCRKVYERYYNSINQRIESYEVRKGEKNQLDVPFCYAVLVGKAKKYAQWKTPEDLTVTMILGGKNAKRRVRVFFETSAFYDWKQKLAGER